MATVASTCKLQNCMHTEEQTISNAPRAEVPRVARHVSVNRRQGSLSCCQGRACLLLHLRGPWGGGQRRRGRARVPVVQQDAWTQAAALSRAPRMARPVRSAL